MMVDIKVRMMMEMTVGMMTVVIFDKMMMKMKMMMVGMMMLQITVMMMMVNSMVDMMVDMKMMKMMVAETPMVQISEDGGGSHLAFRGVHVHNTSQKPMRKIHS